MNSGAACQLKAGADEFIHILVQLFPLLFVDVHHVSAFIVGKADILPNRRLKIHVGHGVLNAIKRRREIVISADNQHFQR